MLDQIAAQRILHFLQRRETDQRVAGADVEVDVGQRFDLLVAVELRHKLEEQAQLADLYRLFHDVDAVQVVDDDRLEDEVAFAGVLLDLSQHFPEVLHLLRAVLAPRPVEVVEKAAHGVETGVVQRLQHAERGEQERAGAARGVEDGDVAQRLPERADQLRSLAGGDHVLGELLHVQVVRDQVVDGRDLVGGELRADFLVAPTAGDVLAPRLGRQAVDRGCRFVPPAALRHVVYAGGDLRRQRLLVVQGPLLVDVPSDAVAHRFVKIAVGVVRQQPPHAAAGLERDGAVLLRPVEQERDDGVAADVAGDVLLGVVGPHLLLVDVLLEDVAEHVGVDLLVVAQRPVVEVPVKLVEECEYLLERLVGDADVGIVALQVMDVEQAAVQVGDTPEQFRQVGGAVDRGLPQALVEEPQQEQPVEAVEPAATPPPAQALQAVAQVVPVAVEEAALLDEVDEHHPVEHQRGVPFAVRGGGDAFDEVEERAVLLLEAVVEPAGDLLDVEGSAHAARHVHDGEVFFFVQGEDELVELLDQRLTRLVPAMDVRAGPVGTPRFALDPLPVLRAAVVRGVHDEVLADGPGDGLLDLLAGGVVGKRFVRVGGVPIGDHPALVSDGFKHEPAARGLDLDVSAAVVPAEVFDEQTAQIAIVQTALDGGPVESDRHEEPYRSSTYSRRCDHASWGVPVISRTSTEVSIP